MATPLPFVNSTGALKRLLNSIKTAKTPAKFTYDYMKNEMGVTERAMIPLLKKLGFLDGGGVPTELYKDFRNPDKSKTTMGKAIEQAYSPVYSRNEYVHKAKKSELKSTIASITENDHDSRTVQSIVNTFNALESFASFDFKNMDFDDEDHEKEEKDIASSNESDNFQAPPQPGNVGLNLGLGYTVNLILPETTNIEVFNAIFKSINEHLLRR